MKKFILLSFALLLSVSASFGYRSFYLVQVNGEVRAWCDHSGGTCLPTVEVNP